MKEDEYFICDKNLIPESLSITDIFNILNKENVIVYDMSKFNDKLNVVPYVANYKTEEKSEYNIMDYKEYLDIKKSNDK